MKRTFTAIDLVQLPRLDASGAQTLCTEVLSTAKPILADKAAAKKIPEGVVEAYEDLAHALDTLNGVVATRLPLAASADPAREKAADVKVDAIWSGLRDVLIGWSKIPGIPEAQIASSLRAMLFPNGLKFTQIAFRLEWAQSNTRIVLIKERGLEPQLKKLGAGKILEQLYEAHREYGEVLGITSPAEVAEPDGPTVREALAELMEALRTFVVRVAGMISKRDPKRTELAEQLLAPIKSWESTAARNRAPEAPADAPEATSEGAPSAAEPPAPPAATPAAGVEPVAP